MEPSENLSPQTASAQGESVLHIKLLLAALVAALSPHIHHQAVSTPVESAHHGHAIKNCVPAHYRRTMTKNEVWLASHETGDGHGSMDPTPRDVNSSSGARELGQLLPSTFPAYGLHSSWNPCKEVKHLRVYAKGRYGNERNAVEFWKANNWY